MTDPTQTPAPSAAWSAPAEATAARSQSGVTITLLPGQLLALAGGVFVVVSAWLEWLQPDRNFGPFQGLDAYDLPAQFLWRDRLAFAGGPALGYLVLFGGLACLLAVFARPLAVLALPAGLGAVVLAVWFALRLRSFFDAGGRDLGDVLGIGAIVAGAGGALAVAGGIVSLTTRR